MTRHPILALWAVPRCASTAFERMMIERGDHHVVDEPYSAHYYFGPQRESRRFDRIEPRSTPDEILADLEEAAGRRPVFLKDMAYHVASVASEELVGRFRNAFLVREPRAAISSLASRWPDFTDAEAGFDAMEVVASLVEAVGQELVVIDHGDLCGDPERVVEVYCDRMGIPFLPGALTWSAGMRPEWHRWADWHASAASSTGFARSATEAPLDGGARVGEVAERSRAAYERLRARRLAPRS